ncbi:MAG: choice-of-anchor L domain-containing protein [Flavipsychrobacter sp.]|nr:choice-of-anchor L domain-containing protein [Flavipsychrobacter sp.]
MKHSWTKLGKAFFLFAFVFSFHNASAQLMPQPSTLQQWLAKFVGSNVTVLNPTLVCAQNEYGIFDNGNTTNLGIDAGVILATCPVADIDQPVGIQVAGGLYTPGNPILTAICGFNTNDACVVEFDFTAELDTVSTLSFQYVFASEEYPEYACSVFNDPFAFIISGPGIVGNQNIAVVPGTNIPVTINSINNSQFPGPNCLNMGPGAPFSQYYVDNQGLGGQTIVFDGFTTVLTAEAQPIQPCDTYHMFIGIANASDNGWQSAVFLREHSFTVDSTTRNLAGLVPSNSGGYLIEGCTPLSIVYTHDTAINRVKKLCFHYGGSALNGIDYTLLPDTLLIPANQYADSLVIFPLLDGIQETFNTWDPVTGHLIGAVTDTIKIYEINCCTLDTLHPKDSIIIPIRDSLYMNLLTRDTFYCEGSVDTTIMHVTGDNVYNYLWTPTSTVGNPTDTITWALPMQTTTYTVTASYPGCPEVSRQVTITLDPLPLVNVSPNDTSLCVTEPVQLNSTVDPPNSPYAYSWSPVDGNLSNTNIPNPTFYYFGSGIFTYTLSVTTPNGCLGTDSIRIEAFPGVIGDIRISDTGICSNDSLYIEVDVTPPSMEATSTYQWSPSTFLSNDQVMEPTYYTTINEYRTYTYTLITTNEYGCHDTDQINITSLVLPDVNIMDDTALCLHEPTQIHMVVKPLDGQFTYNWTPTTNLGDPTVKEPYFFNSFNTDHADYTLYVEVTEVVGGCRNVDSVHIHTYPHVFLTAIDDQLIHYNDKVQLDANNALGHTTYYAWTPPAALNDPNIKSPVAHVTDPVLYTVYGINEWGCRDTADVKINVDYTMDEFVPSVFSPNGDGKNDVFRVLNLKNQRLIEFRVFNRWGKEVYNSPDPTRGWDGTYNGEPQDPGVYNYVIRINLPGPGGDQRTYTGNVTLIR